MMTYNAIQRISERREQLRIDGERLLQKYGTSNERANNKIKRYADFICALDKLAEILHRAGVADTYEYAPVSSEFYGMARGMQSRLTEFKSEIEPLLQNLD